MERWKLPPPRNLFTNRWPRTLDRKRLRHESRDSQFRWLLLIVFFLHLIVGKQLELVRFGNCHRNRLSKLVRHFDQLQRPIVLNLRACVLRLLVPIWVVLRLAIHDSNLTKLFLHVGKHAIPRHPNPFQRILNRSAHRDHHRPHVRLPTRMD